MENPKEYLTVARAAEFLGVSAQTLRRWDAEGKIKPVRRPGSAYRYYRRADLEPFRLDYQRALLPPSGVADFFRSAAFNIEENPRLRIPQREAHRAVREHFRVSKDHAVLQIPVGCGKTGIMATLPFGIADGRVLIIAPNLTIRQVVSEALDVSSPDCFCGKTRVLESLKRGPFSALLDGPTANIHDCSESHFVVTNIQQLASSADRWLPQFPPNFFDMILVDEGHHNVAPSWLRVFEKFPDAKVVSLTATPFRADGQQMKGRIIYHYSYAKAMVNGYIKQIHSVNVAPAEIYFTYRDDVHRHSLDEVLELREEAWFRRGVALAPECNKHIAEASILRCLALRTKTGLKHQIIAAACSVDHARQIRAVYEQLGMECREIYGEMDPEKQESALMKLRDGKLDCIVQVQMLGEGFDHPPLSIAAVFRPFRSLSPYAQFIGRIMRVLHQDDPEHPDNYGYVVSHVGLNNDANWSDFRDVDFDDQAVFHRLLADSENEPDGQSDGGQPRRFDTGMLVKSEIISHFVGQAFLDPDDDRVLDEILAQRVAGTALRVANLTSRAELRLMLKRQQLDVQATTGTIPITPQRHRRAVRKRLFERTNSVVARILRELAISGAGREISQSGNGVGGANRIALTQILNRAINTYVGISSKKRNALTGAQIEKVYANLDLIGDDVRDAVRTNLNKGAADA